MGTYKTPYLGDYPHNRLMVLTIQCWDGTDSLANWTIQPGSDRESTFDRLVEHSVKVGLDVKIATTKTKMTVTLNLRPHA